jgi:hypothetical protein
VQNPYAWVSRAQTDQAKPSMTSVDASAPHERNDEAQQIRDERRNPGSGIVATFWLM